MFESLSTWFFSLGDQYGVNPIIFGSIYVGAIPFFTVSIAWLVRNIRRKNSIVLPTLAAGLCFTSAYIYLIIAGRNVPVWVYVVIALLVAFGAYSTYRKVQTQLHRAQDET